MRILEKNHDGAELLRFIFANPGVQEIICVSEAEWHEERMFLFTASDASAICNRNSFKGKLKLWYQKLGQTQDPAMDAEAAEAGHFAEHMSSSWYAKRTGAVVVDPGEWTIITNKKYPGLGATLDRVQSRRDRIMDGPGILELKNVREYQGDQWDRHPPEHALVQAQIQMLLTGLKWGTIAAVIGGNKLKYYDVEANPRFQAQIVRAIARFQKSLLMGQPPKPTGHETDNAVIDAAFPVLIEDTVDAGAKFCHLYEEWEGLAAQKKPLEKRISEIQSIVRAAMEGHEKLVGTGYQFKLSESYSTCSYSITPESLEEAVRIHEVLLENNIPFEVKGGTLVRRLTKSKRKVS